VWVSDIYDLNDALKMINGIGQMTDRKTVAESLIETNRGQIALIDKRSPLRVFYHIWRKPRMAAGNNTFIHWMIENIGLINCAAEKPRYPQLSTEEIEVLKPDVVLLSSEPYPFQEKHKAELKSIAPPAKIMLVDGEMFSWYGSRLKEAPAYLNSLEFS
jgi:ABC-type Fe3+-hydroxamate transport system substrate-binding protein